jgi:hypothetical protein
VLTDAIFSTADISGAWALAGLTGLISIVVGAIALRTRTAVMVFISVILLNLAGTFAWLAIGDQGYIALLQANALCLALSSLVLSLIQLPSPSSVPHAIAFGHAVTIVHVTVRLSVTIFGVAIGTRVACDLLDLPRSDLASLDWLALLTTSGALTVQLWDPKATFPVRGLYYVGFAVVGMLLILRDLSPGTYFVWTGICELTGFVLVTALAGWAISRFPFFEKRLRVPNPPGRWSGNWFRISQAVLASTAVPLIIWIALDSRFDGMGESHALLGLAGRLASCPAALILLGGTIVMAWQTEGRWRAAWQFASLAIGVLFTTVIGWSRIESASNSLWSRCCSNLMITSAMMTLLTRFGLARVLPNSGDWIERARRAAPVFAGIAALMFVMVLVLRRLG